MATEIGEVTFSEAAENPAVLAKLIKRGPHWILESILAGLSRRRAKA